MAQARVGALSVGTLFLTRLTGRAGEVRAQEEQETAVALQGDTFIRRIHKGVIVDVLEYSH